MASSQRIRLLSIGFVIVVVCSVSLISMIGTTQTRTGWVTVGAPVAAPQTANGFEYQTKLKTDSKLFRGNDFFRVLKPEIIDDQATVVSQFWDSTDAKGRVKFTSAQPLPPEQRIAVRYDLSLRFEKLFTAGLLGLGLCLLLFVLKRAWRNPMALTSAPAIRICQIALAASFVTFVFWNVCFPGWLYGDDHFILTGTVIGQDLPFLVMPDQGRFFPLGLMDLYILSPFGDNPTAYHIEKTILLLIVMSGLYFVCSRKAGACIGCLIGIAYLTTPDLFRVHADAIFVEPLLSALLVLFLVCYDQSTRTQKPHYGIACCLLATIATYCKEPVFGMLAVMAGTQLLFGWKQMSRQLRFINGYLILNSVAFLVIYYLACSTGGSYAAQRSAELTSMNVLLGFCKQPVLLIAFLTCIYRLICLTFTKRRDLVFFDGLLFAETAYVLAYAVLKLDAAYYLVPAYVFLAMSFSGYLGKILNGAVERARSSNHSDSANHTVRSWNLRKPVLGFTACLSILMFAAAFQLPQTTKCVFDTLSLRKETRTLTRLFASLNDEGYELCMYTPDETEGHDITVHKWRRHVVNVFDSRFRDHLQHSDQQQSSPFRMINRSDLAKLPAKSLVIHPSEVPVTGEWQSIDSQVTGDRFQAAFFLPPVMGAKIYARATCMPEIQKTLKLKTAQVLRQANLTPGKRY